MNADLNLATLRYAFTVVGPATTMSCAGKAPTPNGPVQMRCTGNVHKRVDAVRRDSPRSPIPASSATLDGSRLGRYELGSPHPSGAVVP